MILCKSSPEKLNNIASRRYALLNMNQAEMIRKLNERVEVINFFMLLQSLLSEDGQQKVDEIGWYELKKEHLEIVNVDICRDATVGIPLGIIY